MKTKKTIQKNWLGALMGLSLVIGSAGCSDGVLPLQNKGGENPILTTPLPPEVLSFGANTLEVEPGASVTLSWEVTGADLLEITSSSTKTAFNYSTTEAFESSTVVENLQENTTFTLTATKNPEAAVTEGEKEGQEEAPAQMLGKQAAPETPAEGDEEAEDCISPVEGEDVPADAKICPPPAPEPAVVTRTVTVIVKSSADSLKVENFYVDAPKTTEGNYSVSAGEKVVLQWSVVPRDANVRLTASTGEQPIKGECEASSTKEMESEGEVTSEYPASGCATVQPSQTTTYTLTATFEDKEVTQSLVVEIAQPEEPELPPAPAVVDCSQISVDTLSGSVVFSGERVGVAWQMPTEALAVIANVTVSEIGGESVTELASKGVTHLNTKSGLFTISFKDASGVEKCSKSAGVSLASFDWAAEGNVVKMTRNAADGRGVYAGLDAGGYNGGKIEMLHLKPAAQKMAIDFGKALKGFDKVTALLNDIFLDKKIKDYPVNGVTVSASGTVFAATTGAVLYSADGKNWNALTSLLKAAGSKGDSGEHATCYGKTLGGRAGDFKGDVASMNQVCDLEATADGKLYVATDRGLFWLNNVDGFIADKKSESWNGKDSSLAGSVVNDVVAAGGKIYAASANGVYVDEGSGFNKLGEGLSGEVYAVAARDNSAVDAGVMIAAATSEGLYTLADTTWTKQDGVSGKVYTVAYDDDGRLYSGGDSGLYVNGKAMAVFKEGSVVVRSVAAFKAGNDYYVYVGTEQGVLKAYVENIKTAVRTPMPAQPETSVADFNSEPEPSAESTSESTVESGVAAGTAAAEWGASGSVMEVQ